MVYDDIIIGSGLTALATAYGLPVGRRILVLTGGEHDNISYYDPKTKIPCQNLGFGGLGNYWHGVISMHHTTKFPLIPDSVINKVFQIFYPQESVDKLIGSPWLFVPFKPIRPKLHWRNLSESRLHLSLIHMMAHQIHRKNGIWIVKINDHQYIKSIRLWVAAGALGTPTLFERSEEYSTAVLPTISDHLILYVGQTNRKMYPYIPSPSIRHTSSGYWIKASSNFGNSGLITTKPAYCTYKSLDQSIEQRSAFGLPASSALRKIIKAKSFGFFAEAIFNKFGLFPNSQILSVYAQIRVKDGYRRLSDMQNVQANEAYITSCIRNFRSTLNQDELLLSQRPDLYMHGIHMHRTLNTNILPKLGINTEKFGCFVVDASAVDDIGSEHPSFRLMTRAFHLAYVS